MQKTTGVFAGHPLYFSQIEGVEALREPSHPATPAQYEAPNSPPPTSSNPPWVTNVGSAIALGQLTTFSSLGSRSCGAPPAWIAIAFKRPGRRHAIWFS